MRAFFLTRRAVHQLADRRVQDAALGQMADAELGLVAVNAMRALVAPVVAKGYGGEVVALHDVVGVAGRWAFAAAAGQQLDGRKVGGFVVV